MIQTFAHVSDLCIGRDGAEDAARRICAALAAARVDQVLVTGDLTNRGLREELSRFEDVFAPLIDGDRLIVVPGDRDRMGDDAAALVSGARVSAGLHGAVYVVRVDSTAAAGGESVGDGVTLARIGEIEAVLSAAPADMLRVLLLHHPPVRMRGDEVAESRESPAGARFAPLRLGGHLLESIVGRCDLVVHGHCDAPSDIELLGHAGRPLRIVGAGSTTEMECARVFAHDADEVVGQRWLHADAAVVPDAAKRAATSSELDVGLGASESSSRVAA